MRVLKKGGVIVVTVPAKEELWSWFDEMSFHKRRYTKEMLIGMNLTPLLIKYIVMIIYMPMKYMHTKKAKNNVAFKINELINTLLKWVFNTERPISKCLSLPIGTSFVGVACKTLAFGALFPVIWHGYC